MATLDQITDGIIDVLETTIGLRGFDHIPEQINPPAVIVNPVEMVEDAFAGSSVTYQIDVVLLTARTSPRIGTGTLNELTNPTGPKSAWVALNAHDDLGLTDGTQLRIVRWRSIGAEEIGLYSYLGRVIETMVTTLG